MIFCNIISLRHNKCQKDVFFCMWITAYFIMSPLSVLQFNFNRAIVVGVIALFDIEYFFKKFVINFNCECLETLHACLLPYGVWRYNSTLFRQFDLTIFEGIYITHFD